MRACGDSASLGCGGKCIVKTVVLWSTIPATLGQGQRAEPVYVSIQFSADAQAPQTAGFSPALEYEADLEVLAGALAAGEPPVFVTTTHFDVPGAVVSARVYAITGDDRENDSRRCAFSARRSEVQTAQRTVRTTT